MAGIYIPGMEMPTGNGPITLFIYPDGKVIVCGRLGPLDRYEAIPVPDHGRLGDLDALDGLLEGLSEDDYNRTHAPKNWERALSVMRDYLDVVPTIIPVSKEVDNG